jgi:hypothetical protein
MKTKGKVEKVETCNDWPFMPWGQQVSRVVAFWMRLAEDSTSSGSTLHT